MRILFFLSSLILVVAIAFWRGRSDERWAAMICVLGTAFSYLAWELNNGGDRFVALPFVVDVAVLLGFMAIALRSDRYWPLWVTGFQLTATTVHLLKLLQPDLMPFVFFAALAFWSYPILLLVGIGAWRTAAVERWRRHRRLPEFA